MKPTRLVVIGNGMVGHRFLEEIVARELALEITVFSEESRPAYDRVQLSSYFSGASAEDLSLVTPAFFADHGIRLMLGESVSRIDRERRIVIGSAGTEVPYDTLVLATGSYPFVPPIDGNDREACHVYRTI
ncbi:MAG: FAD-dependent oxidoreductase, partial [Paraperlucidibaca sp.]